MQASPTRLNPRALAVSALADLACVLVFVAVGRSSHEEGITLGGLLGTGWPFWLGVAGGYVGVVAFRLAPASVPGAAMVVMKTLVVGMILRNVVQHDGTPVSFVLVAAGFLLVTTVGWRAAARAAAIRRLRITPASPPKGRRKAGVGTPGAPASAINGNNEPAGPHEASRPESLQN